LLFDEYEGFIIDLDGVIYLLNEPVPGSSAAVKRLQEAGAKFLFVTNNSASTPRMYVDRLGKFDIDITREQMLTSSQAAGIYLDRNYEVRGKSAVVIGEHGVLEELENRGMTVLPHGEWEGAEFVFVGWDRHFDYEKLRAAVVAVRAGATFIAMNADATYPTPDCLWPGAGTMVAAVSTGAAARPYVVGKPNPFIIEMALERLGVERRRALVIGDRLDSDIEAGNAAGVDTMMVLTGISSEDEIAREGPAPTHVRDDLAGLFE
jgi:4-nitrophenyl phosphatase